MWDNVPCIHARKECMSSRGIGPSLVAQVINVTPRYAKMRAADNKQVGCGTPALLCCQRVMRAIHDVEEFKGLLPADAGSGGACLVA